MPSFLDTLVGAKPVVPTLPPLDLGTEAGKAIAANQKNLPGAEKLVGAANQFSIDQITKMLESVVPGYSKMVGSATANIASELKGEIPTDVAGQVQNSAAARALGGGFAGSGMHGDLVARDLGLTSLALTDRGLSSFENWTKTAASLYEPSMLNVGSMFVSPQQQASFDVEERNSQFQRDWMKSQIDAMPAPWAEDLKQFVYRAMSMYSGTSVPNNPYSTPGSFGGGLGGAGMGAGGEGGVSFGPGGSNYSTTFMDSSGGFGGNTSDPGSAAGGGAMDIGSGGGGFLGLI